MQIIKYPNQTSDLFGGLSQLRRELDTMFDLPDSSWSAPLRTFGLLEGAWSPCVDVYNEKDSIRVRAELPGLKKDDIHLSIQGDTLILEGERKRESTQEDRNYHRVERTYGQFHRAISLPVAVNAAEIKASYQDGILDVVLPKKEEAKPKQIQVDVK
jgi:HSP20 family protein